MTPGQTIHFVGIGGIGMSGIARICLLQGYHVQGTDMKLGPITLDLERLGAKITIGHDARYLGDAEVLVYSSSIPENHPERTTALKQGLEILHRSQALAELTRGKFTIAVTGTHGKTTTTALIGSILKEAGRDPSIVVGGWVQSLGGNACFGKGKEMVIEADESDSSFLNFSPDIEVITNIEEEHLDHFENIQNIEAAYKNFVKRLKSGGEWLGCSEDPRVLDLAGRSQTVSTLYGFDATRSSIFATDVSECPDGRRSVFFNAWKKGEFLGPVETRIIGTHNVLNALAAIGVGLKLGIDFSVIQRALAKYEGADRRFDVKYEDPEFLVVDDYAHHPTEIRKTLAAAKALHKKRIVALFQPHRYTRTEALLEQFGTSFKGADKLIVTDIYAASEAPREGLSGDKVCRVIQKAGHRDAVFVGRAHLDEYLRSRIEPGDLVISLGAGDIFQTVARLSEFLRHSRQNNGTKLPVFGSLRGKILLNEPLSKHTTLKVGGPAEFWIEPEDAEDLKNALKVCRENNLKIRLLGGGSNILAPDEGLRGAVISLVSPYFRRLRFENGRIFAGAGVPNTSFITFAMDHGLGGCEFLLGIPGCIGGALAMNAGSHGQWIETLVDSVTKIDFNGLETVLKKKEVPFTYRSSGNRDAVITEGVFLLPTVSRKEMQNKLDEYRDYRQATQDLRYPSAGCMFKNPPNADLSSGKLIDSAGLKGRRIGNAQISLKHANFIINLGGATAKDIISLIEETKQTVKRRFNIELETEVKIL